MHCCCAPCFTYIENDIKLNGILNEDGRKEEVDLTACFYNPNIHPKVEYERRKNAFTKFCKIKECKNVIINEYNMKEYVRFVVENVGKDKEFKSRCEYCYYMRLKKVFEYAKENGFEIDMKEFDRLFEAHQQKSRAGSEQKFKGGLAEQNEETIAYHTATHLLNAALKKVLGSDTHQKGSNITTERMRFDFNCDHKLTDEEKAKIEEIVNDWIKAGLDVKCEEMKKEDAVKSGAECMFIEKYPDIVTVYTIGDISKELCGGPHVKNTSELGKFKIKKEEASSFGIRRIKAVLIKE